MLFIIDEFVKGINIWEVVRMRSSLTVSMMAWSVGGSDVTIYVYDRGGRRGHDFFKVVSLFFLVDVRLEVYLGVYTMVHGVSLFTEV